MGAIGPGFGHAQVHFARILSNYGIYGAVNRFATSGWMEGVRHPPPPRVTPHQGWTPEMDTIRHSLFMVFNKVSGQIELFVIMREAATSMCRFLPQKPHHSKQEVATTIAATVVSGMFFTHSIILVPGTARAFHLNHAVCTYLTIQYP